MTIETQLFVSPQDVIGLRLQCNCGSKMSLPISDKFKMALLGLQHCPNCNAHWFQGDRDDRLMQLVNLVNSIEAVRDATKEFKFRVALELVHVPASREGA
jgi:hypothetical protein